MRPVCAIHGQPLLRGKLAHICGKCLEEIMAQAKARAEKEAASGP